MHRKSMTYARPEATSCCELPGATASPLWLDQMEEGISQQPGIREESPGRSFATRA